MTVTIAVSIESRRRCIKTKQVIILLEFIHLHVQLTAFFVQLSDLPLEPLKVDGRFRNRKVTLL